MSSSRSPTAVPPPEEAPPQQIDGGAGKKKRRRLRGTPDPDAEVVALSPPALLAWKNRWRVCKTCGRQGLRLHHKSLRRYVLPSSSNKREASPRKRRKLVFVCPEPGCEYHAPSRALADLPTLHNHFRRKHARHGLWACVRDPGASCDGCRRVVSQAESDLDEPHDTSQQPGHQPHDIVVGASPSSHALVASPAMASPTAAADASVAALGPSLSPPTPHSPAAVMPRLDLSLGNGGGGRERDDDAAAARLMVEGAREQLVAAMAEKAAADEDRALARRRAEMAGVELACAQRMQQLAQVELRSAVVAARQLVVSARLRHGACYTSAAAASSTTPGLPR